MLGTTGEGVRTLEALSPISVRFARVQEGRVTTSSRTGLHQMQEKYLAGYADRLRFVLLKDQLAEADTSILAALLLLRLPNMQTLTIRHIREIEIAGVVRQISECAWTGRLSPWIQQAYE